MTMDTHTIKDLFIKHGAIQQGHFYRLSGRHTDWYVQCARLFEDHKTGELVGRELASRCAGYEPDVVLAAAVGAVLPGCEVARALGKKLLYCEKRDGALILRRGFEIHPGMKVLLVEDEVSTGQSIREMTEIVRALGGSVVAIGCLVDKSGGEVPAEAPLIPLLRFRAEHYPPDVCPMCKEGMPLQNLR